MKKIVILLLFVFTACEIEYDGETKLIVKGIILDDNNDPIKNKDIKLFVSRESASNSFVWSVPSESNFIGKAKTNSDGAFTLAIPKPKANYSEIIIVINEQQNQYNEKQLRNIQVDNFINYELNLGIQKIYDISNLALLTVTANRINTNKELVRIEYIGEVANEIEFLNPMEINYLYNEINKKVVKNQNIIIRYTLKNYATNVDEIVEDTILIDSSPLINYNLNY
ncbi:hypothetical protein ACFSX9_11440 [Flavobacterium ardleyense]|uniref:Carboxypeptidase regulatory-like domain-containing protein n=1 Tax=Flavobacterium ardleyense TaxID=2038737 RepID=A0ABW5ZA03_9FLAO